MSNQVPPSVVDANQRYPVPEANAILRQSNAKTYADIKAGKIQVIRDGARTYIPGTELIRLSTLPRPAIVASRESSSAPCAAYGGA
jgi:hypothetical protein